MVKTRKRKRKVSSATRARLKALRRKHGLGEFKTHTLSKRRGASKMPRRRKARRIYVSRRRTRYRRRSSGGVSMKNLLWMGAGAGISGTIGAVISKYLPLGNFGSVMGGNVAEGLTGFALYKWGGKIAPQAKLIGAGMLIKVAGDIVENTVAPALSGVIGGTNAVATGATPVSNGNII